MKSLSHVLMDYSLPGSSVHGIFQARVLEWGAIAFSECMHTCMLSRFSCVQFFVSLWTVACQTPLCMGFSRQEYCSGLPFLSPEDLPYPGIKRTSLASLALAGGFLTTNATREAFQFSSVQFNSVAQSCPTLCDSMNCSTPGLKRSKLMVILTNFKKIK